MIKIESRRRIKRAVLKTMNKIEVADDNSLIQPIVPLTPLIENDLFNVGDLEVVESKNDVDKSQFEELENNCGDFSLSNCEEAEKGVDSWFKEEYEHNCSDDSLVDCKEACLDKASVNLCDDLKDWAIVFNITQRALSANLKFLIVLVILMSQLTLKRC